MRKSKNSKHKEKYVLKEQKIKFQSFLIILFTIIITIIIHNLFVPYNWYWIIFTWGIIISPILVINLKFYLNKNTSLKFEKIKNEDVKLLFLMLWYWYIDIVYMVIFNNWTIWIYVLGTITIIKIFYGLIMTFLNNKIKNYFYNPTLIINFLIGIGLTIYLIYIIENNALRDIIKTIISSIYGGILTLVGVAWTIKHTKDEAKNEEIKKNKPLIYIVDFKHADIQSKTIVSLNRSDISKYGFKKGNKYRLKDFILENADYSYSSLKGICINNRLISMNIAQLFRKNEQYHIKMNFDFLFNETINDMSLLLMDMLDNYYLMKINIDVNTKANVTYIKVVSGIEIVRAEVDFKSLTVKEILNTY